MNEHFLHIDMEKWDKITNWLNGLVGLTTGKGKVIRIIEWQVVPTGRPYEYNAVARVELEQGAQARFV